jgi:hypothetical protein
MYVRTAMHSRTLRLAATGALVVTLGLVACGERGRGAADPGAAPTPVAALDSEQRRDRRIGRLEAYGCAAGSCPVYELELYDDGSIWWRGRVNVASIGERRGQLDDAGLAAAKAALAEVAARGERTPPYHTCADPSRELSYYAKGGWYADAVLLDDCESAPDIVAIVDRVAAAIGADTWIRTNPPAPGGPLPDGARLLVTMEQGVCMGECPIYDVTVFDDGTVLWVGERHVAAIGERRWTLPSHAVAAIADAFAAARFTRMDEQGEVVTPPEPCPDDLCAIPIRPYFQCTDTSHTLVTYHRGGLSKTIDDAHCQETSLSRLEDRVKALIGVKRWIAP